VVNIVYSDEAIQDLEDIGDYIAYNLFNPEAALNIVGKIQDAIDNLNDFPLIGTPLSSVTQFNTDYRYLVIGSYLAFYRSLDSKVFVDRILYGKRDYVSLLLGETIEDDEQEPC
jgi:addiction module RelE/StbE family toxin